MLFYSLFMRSAVCGRSSCHGWCSSRSRSFSTVACDGWWISTAILYTADICSDLPALSSVQLAGVATHHVITIGHYVEEAAFSIASLCTTSQVGRRCNIRTSSVLVQRTITIQFWTVADRTINIE